MIKIYDRYNKKYIEEEQFGQKTLNFLYNTFIGRILLKIAINPITSKLIGLYKKSSFSKNSIKKMIKDYDIDMSIYEDKEYNSFNDFFTRNIKLNKRKMINNSNYFISPADSKLLVYRISDDCILNIKSSNYSLSELVKDKMINALQLDIPIIVNINTGNNWLEAH